ncbi:MAG: hypothetical protein LIO96_14050 [Lachnospiraceae bacterium]|nr:hypothetical protein [Lachnospiraceae bacterium]
MDSFREEFVRSRGKLWYDLGHLLHNLSEEYGYYDYETFEQEVMLEDMSFEEAGIDFITVTTYFKLLDEQGFNLMLWEYEYKPHVCKSTLDAYNFYRPVLDKHYENDIIHRKDVWDLLVSCVGKYISKETVGGKYYIWVQPEELQWDTLLVYGCGLDEDALEAIKNDIIQEYGSRFKSTFRFPMKGDVMMEDIWYQTSIALLNYEGKEHEILDLVQHKNSQQPEAVPEPTPKETQEAPTERKRRGLFGRRRK